MNEDISPEQREHFINQVAELFKIDPTIVTHGMYKALGLDIPKDVMVQ